MALPKHARVEAAPNFLSTLEAARVFFIEQGSDAAEQRFRKLKAQLREMVELLAWSPASGRPARFLYSRSAQARLRTEAVLALAEKARLPNLREYVVDQHIVLYAHSDDEVVLLAVKHQRQFTY